VILITEKERQKALFWDKIKIMKNIFFFGLVLLFAVAGCQQPTQQPATQNDASPAELMINLTSDATVNPHSSLMGLHLAQNALKNEIPVSVFLNVSGVKLMLPQSDTISFHGENLHEVLQDILEKGGDIIACPHCMEANGVTEENLMEGVIKAKEEVLFGKIKGNPTVFTY
jgi:predicted peroxiredoxin